MAAVVGWAPPTIICWCRTAPAAWRNRKRMWWAKPTLPLPPSRGPLIPSWVAAFSEARLAAASPLASVLCVPASPRESRPSCPSWLCFVARASRPCVSPASCRRSDGILEWSNDAACPNPGRPSPQGGPSRTEDRGRTESHASTCRRGWRPVPSGASTIGWQLSTPPVYAAPHKTNRPPQRNADGQWMLVNVFQARSYIRSDGGRRASETNLLRNRFVAHRALAMLQEERAGDHKGPP
jgi:hypothetical protein